MKFENAFPNMHITTVQPTEGKYTAMWFYGHLWTESVIVEDDGVHYAYNDCTDSWDRTLNTPHVAGITIYYAVEKPE